MDRISRKIEFRLTRCIKFWRNEITSGDVHREKKEITFFTGSLIFITIDIIESFLPINQDKIPLARPKINRMYIYIWKMRWKSEGWHASIKRIFASYSYHFRFYFSIFFHVIIISRVIRGRRSMFQPHTGRTFISLVDTGAKSRASIARQHANHAS